MVMQKIQQFWGQRWLTAHTLNLPAHWHQLWAEYTNALALSHVRIKDCEDELLWIHSKKEYYTPKEGYLYAYASKEPEVMDWWWKLIWKLKSPPKAKLFLWCLLTNKIPTGENLERRFFFRGASWCPLRDLDVESADHLFLACHIAVQIWNFIYQALHISLRRQGNQ